jgi:hypothetical protein
MVGSVRTTLFKWTPDWEGAFMAYEKAGALRFVPLVIRAPVMISFERAVVSPVRFVQRCHPLIVCMCVYCCS